jgi:hypothetical protein
MYEDPVLVILATAAQYDGGNVIFTRHSTATLAIICTDNPPVDPFMYIIAVQRYRDSTTSLNIHAMNLKSSYCDVLLAKYQAAVPTEA